MGFRIHLHGGPWHGRRLESHRLSLRPLQTSWEPEKFLGLGRGKGQQRASRRKVHSKAGSGMCCPGNISGRVQWGILWNLKYSQFKRKQGGCRPGGVGARGGAAPGYSRKWDVLALP